MFRRLITGAALLALPMGGLAAQQKTLDQVLQCHYEAIGGLKAWQDIESMQAFGSMQAGGIQAPLVMYEKRPQMQRVEFTYQGMTGIQAFDGQTGWMIMPFAGSTEPETMPEEQAKQMREGGGIDGALVDYQKKGIQVKLVGTEDVSGTQAYRLEITMRDSTVQYYDLDTDYCLPFRVEGKRQQGDQTLEYETTIGDYKPEAGLMMPHSIQTQVKGMPQAAQTITLDSVKVNVPLPDSLFTMPKKN
jgi:outer membrane lipoprotein-sorting protein